MIAWYPGVKFFLVSVASLCPPISNTSIDTIPAEGTLNLIVIIGLQLSMCHNKIPAPPSDYIDEVNMSNFAKNIDNTVIGYDDRYQLTGYTEIKKT